MVSVPKASAHMPNHGLVLGWCKCGRVRVRATGSSFGFRSRVHLLEVRDTP